MSELVVLRHESGDTAAINFLGAELSSWRAQDKELIWKKNPAIWDQTAPVLFPIVGWTRHGQIRVNGAAYPLALHGFAWKKNFLLTYSGADHARLSLQDDEQTRALYPFHFRFDCDFILSRAKLKQILTITNTDTRPLPYACGMHPAFCWPLGQTHAEHAIIFDKTEKNNIPIITTDGLFSNATRVAPFEREKIILNSELFNKEALCFLNINSKKISYDNGAGMRLSLSLSNFQHIALWSRPNAPFVCIEPWTGYGDPEGFEGDLYQKPSMTILAPGLTASHSVTFDLLDEGF